MERAPYLNKQYDEETKNMMFNLAVDMLSKLINVDRNDILKDLYDKTESDLGQNGFNDELKRQGIYHYTPTRTETQFAIAASRLESEAFTIPDEDIYYEKLEEIINVELKTVV